MKPSQKNTFATLKEAIDNIAMMRGYKPYQYGGTWYFAEIGGTAYARRTISSLSTIASRSGVAVQVYKIFNPTLQSSAIL